MNRKNILSIFFILLLIATIISFSYNQYRSYKDEQSVKIYRELVKPEKDQNIDPIITSEDTIEDETVIFNDEPITISDNKNIPLFNAIEDFTGWIKIENSKIDYPVVKAKDNEFYLDHNYKKEKSDAGAIFMDRRNLGNQYDQHTIIYGHNMKDGSMFKDLNKYLDQEFFSTNPIISYEDLYNTYEYQVISAYYISANDHTISFDLNEDTVKSFLNHSLHESDYEYDSDDRILTLATCNYILSNGRMIVHAVLVD